MQLRDRIVEFVKLPTRDLLDHDNNWRTHPDAQRGALSGLLEEVGIVDTLTAYYSEDRGGKLTLIDGHLRKADYTDEEWPVLILDLDDREAGLVLTTLDPIAAMAGADREKLEAILADVKTGSDALQALISQTAEDAGIWLELPDGFPEYDESIADTVEYHECPECGHKWPR